MKRCDEGRIIVGRQGRRSYCLPQFAQGVAPPDPYSPLRNQLPQQAHRIHDAEFPPCGIRSPLLAQCLGWRCPVRISHQEGHETHASKQGELNLSFRIFKLSHDHLDRALSLNPAAVCKAQAIRCTALETKIFVQAGSQQHGACHALLPLRMNTNARRHKTGQTCRTPWEQTSTADAWPSSCRENH